MATQIIRFTKDSLLSLKPPKRSATANGGTYDTYRDAKEKGLVLIVSHGGAKTFYLYRKVHGKPQRVKLGAFPDLSIEQARKKALESKAQIVAGINPNQEKRRLRSETVFSDFFEQDYLEHYAKRHKRSWPQDDANYRLHLASLKGKKLSDITKAEIGKLHARITKNSGAYVANRVLALLSVVFGRAIEQGWKGTNPTTGIKKNKEKARDRFIQGDELGRFFEAVMEESNEIARDYILLSLFCGQRKGNMLAIRWDEIDFSNRQWRIGETKNNHPQILGLPEPAMQILRRRKQEAERIAKESGEKAPSRPIWVFPSAISESGHFMEPKSAWRRILKRAKIKDLRIHDIRRTMGSYMAMSGAGQYLIGKALGHKSSAATEIYARVAVDPVRDAQELAVERMLELMAKAGKKIESKEVNSERLRQKAKPS